MIQQLLRDHEKPKKKVTTVTLLSQYLCLSLENLCFVHLCVNLIKAKSIFIRIMKFCKLTIYKMFFKKNVEIILPADLCLHYTLYTKSNRHLNIT